MDKDPLDRWGERIGHRLFFSIWLLLMIIATYDPTGIRIVVAMLFGASLHALVEMVREAAFRDLEAGMRAIMQERDAIMQERDAIMQELDAIMQERDAIMQEVRH